MKHKWKRAAACALAIGMLFSLSACGKDAAIEKTVTYRFSRYRHEDGELSKEQAVDAYLREAGYSELFIGNTGAETKYFLYQKKAVFQRSTGVPVGAADGEWRGFSADLVVSDASMPESGISVKWLTVNWRWQADRFAEEEKISIEWDESYAALSNSALFELHGSGHLEHAEQNLDYNAPELPLDQTGTYFVASTDPAAIDRQPLVYSEPMHIDMGENSVTYAFSVDFGSMFEMEYYLIDKEGEKIYGGRGYYLIDSSDYRGSFTICIAKFSEINNYRSAVARYYKQDDGAYAEKIGGICDFREYIEE